MTAHKILAADTRYKGAKNFPNFWRTVQIRSTSHAHDRSAPTVALYSPVNSNWMSDARRW
jgi:hypothetical protein